MMSIFLISLTMCLNLSPLSYVDLDGEMQCINVPCGHCYECLLQYQNSWKIRMIEEAKVWKRAYFFTLTYAPENLPMNVVADYPEGREVVGELRGSGVGDLLLDSYETPLSTACKKDVQSWLKRFRTNYVRRKALALGLKVRDVTSDSSLYSSLKPRFTYFITAEYAPEGEYTDRHGKRRKSTQRPHYHGIIFTDIPRSGISLLFGDWTRRFGFVKWEQVRQRSDLTKPNLRVQSPKRRLMPDRGMSVKIIP